MGGSRAWRSRKSDRQQDCDGSRRRERDRIARGGVFQVIAGYGMERAATWLPPIFDSCSACIFTGRSSLLAASNKMTADLR